MKTVDEYEVLDQNAGKGEKGSPEIQTQLDLKNTERDFSGPKASSVLPFTFAENF